MHIAPKYAYSPAQVVMFYWLDTLPFATGTSRNRFQGKIFDANREKGACNKRRLKKPVLLQLFAALPGTAPIDIWITQRNFTSSPNTRAEDGKIMASAIEISSTLYPLDP
jgi:hypothetical protein